MLVTSQYQAYECCSRRISQLDCSIHTSN